MANIKSALGKGAKRYKDLMLRTTAEQLRNEALSRGKISLRSGKMVNNIKKEGIKGKNYEKLTQMMRGDLKATEKYKNSANKYIKEELKSVGARAATMGAVGGAANYALKPKNEKTAFDIVNESFDKVASLNFKKSKNIGKALKNVATGKNIKDAASDLTVASKAGAFPETLKKLKNAKRKEIAKTVGLGAGAASGVGAAGYGTAKALKSREKTATSIVEDTFDKIAAFNFDKVKNTGKKIKNIATGKNVKAMSGALDIADKMNLSADTVKKIKKAKHKEIAKMVGVNSAAASGIGAAGYGASKALKNKEK